ncbi:MAG: hypothetical protein AAF998_24820 [Bacteroidota bacterium]
MEINYESLIRLLNLESEKVIEQLRINNTHELVIEKRNIDNGIKWLKKGMENQIDPNLHLHTLPEPATKTPSSAFRLVEDHESDDKNYWTEVKFNNAEVRPMPGDF